MLLLLILLLLILLLLLLLVVVVLLLLLLLLLLHANIILSCPPDFLRDGRSTLAAVLFILRPITDSYSPSQSWRAACYVPRFVSHWTYRSAGE